jgi:hypothetical protein
MPRRPSCYCERAYEHPGMTNPALRCRHCGHGELVAFSCKHCTVCSLCFVMAQVVDFIYKTPMVALGGVFAGDFNGLACLMSKWPEALRNIIGAGRAEFRVAEKQGAHLGDHRADCVCCFLGCRLRTVGCRQRGSAPVRSQNLPGLAFTLRLRRSRAVSRGCREDHRTVAPTSHADTSSRDVGSPH